MSPRLAFAPTVLAAILLAGATRAEVTDSQPGGFTISDTVEIAAPPARVWRALGEIGSWWDSQHSYSRDARNLSLDLKPGGCWCEALPGGGGAVHMTVVFVKPGQVARMVGGLGPLQSLGVAGSMTWSLETAGDHTKLTMTYDVGGHAAGGLAPLAPLVDKVLAEQVGHLKAYAEAAKP